MNALATRIADLQSTLDALIAADADPESVDVIREMLNVYRAVEGTN